MFNHEEKESFSQIAITLLIFSLIFCVGRFIFGYSFFPVTNSYIETAVSDPIISKLIDDLYSYNFNHPGWDQIDETCSKFWNPNEYCDALSKRLWDLGYTQLTLRPRNLLDYGISLTKEQNKLDRKSRVECLANGSC